MRVADPSDAALVIESTVDDAKGMVFVKALPGQQAAWLPEGELLVAIGTLTICVIPAYRHDGLVVEGSVALDVLRTLDRYDITVRSAGSEVESIDFILAGPFFQALAITSTSEFFDKIQLNHSRYKSPIVLEIGARAAYAQFQGNYPVQAAALTVIAHRFLAMPVTSLKAEDQRVSWLTEQALAIIARGEGLIAQADPDWEDVRWTISLATVAGYLSLIGDRYTRAERFFSVPVRYVDRVKLSRVSALNIVNGCFIHGVLSHVLGRQDVAKASLTTGVRSVPMMVAAQDLMENVWVIGDLMNVMRSARQCFIAMVRMKLIEQNTPVAGPIINDASQILVSDVVGPLHDILLSGKAALLARVIAASGGAI